MQANNFLYIKTIKKSLFRRALIVKKRLKILFLDDCYFCKGKKKFCRQVSNIIIYSF